MNLIMKDIFEMPNRILAERNYIQRSAVEPYGHRLLLLKYCRRNNKLTNEITKKREAPASSKLEYEPITRNDFRDINNQLDQMEESHQRSVAEPCYHQFKLLKSSRIKATKQFVIKKGPERSLNENESNNKENF